MLASELRQTSSPDAQLASQVVGCELNDGTRLVEGFNDGTRLVEGFNDGFNEGSNDGFNDGSNDGTKLVEGSKDGFNDGTELVEGSNDGTNDGSKLALGKLDGNPTQVLRQRRDRKRNQLSKSMTNNQQQNESHNRCELTNHHIEDLQSMGNQMKHYNHHLGQHLH